MKLVQLPSAWETSPIDWCCETFRRVTLRTTFYFRDGKVYLRSEYGQATESHELKWCPFCGQAIEPAVEKGSVERT